MLCCNGKWVSAQIARFMGPTWGPHGPCRPQMGPMLAPWTLLSGMTIHHYSVCVCLLQCCPGYVDTDMTSHKGPKTPDQGRLVRGLTPAVHYMFSLSGPNGEPVRGFSWIKAPQFWYMYSVFHGIISIVGYNYGQVRKKRQTIIHSLVVDIHPSIHIQM